MRTKVDPLHSTALPIDITYSVMESLVFLHFHVEGERHEAAAILKWLHPKDAMVQSKDTRLKILIPVVIERLHGRYYLRPVLVVPSDTSGGVMRKLRTITSQELSEIKSLRVIRAFFWKPVIRTASLSSVSSRLQSVNPKY